MSKYMDPETGGTVN